MSETEGLQLPPPPLPRKDFTAILNAFEQTDCTVSDFLLALLTEKRFKDSIYTSQLLQRSGIILRAWLSHAKLPQEAEKAASEGLHRVYAREIKCLVKPSSGWHFSAQTVMPDDIDNFDINDLTLDTTIHAPLVSSLLDTLLSAKKKPASATDADGDITMATARDSDNDSNRDSDNVDGEPMLEGVVSTRQLTPEEQQIRKKENGAKCKAMLLKLV